MVSTLQCPPYALSTSQLQYLIGGLRERIDFSHVREFTLDMNPATVSLEKAKAMLTLGVNRLSMGTQSWDEELLKTWAASTRGRRRGVATKSSARPVCRM